MKLTEWHPPHIKPVHIGVYEVRDDGDDYGGFSYWDGEKFGWRAYATQATKKSAINRALTAWIDGWETGLPAQTKWRGLASPSK